MTFGFFNGQPSSLHANSQVRVEILALWPAFPLSSVYMLMNGTKSVTELTVKRYSCCLSRLSKEFQQPDCCLYNRTDHHKTLIGWVQLSSNAHKHLRNCGRFINPSLQPQRCIYFRLVPAASDFRLAPDEMDFAWPVCQSAEARILYWGWRMKTAQLSSACFKGVCLIVWQPVEVAEECEGL